MRTLLPVGVVAVALTLALALALACASVKASPYRAYPPPAENPRIDALAARAGAIYAEIGKIVESSGNGGASESALAAMAEGTQRSTARFSTENA